MKRFDIRVQATPQIHNGQMAHYWNIVQINGGSQLTVKDGFASSIELAVARAVREFNAMQ